MKTLIKNGQINTRKNETTPAEIWIENGKIKAIGEGFSEAEFDEVFDAKGQLITPGLVDVHVHLREPGFTYKETIAAGTKAAARGGFTTVCAMPNLNPVPDTPEKLEQVYDLIKRDAVVKVLQYAPITENLRSEVLVDQEAMIKAGAFAFTNDGVGVQTAGTMYQAMKEAAKNNKALVAHTEDESLLFGGVMHAGDKAKELGLPGILSVTESSQIARDLLLAEATGVHYHVCHVSTKESVRVIRDAKKAGIHVTAEVSPHHLILIDEDIPEDFGFWKMNPPLRGKEDREALIEGLLDGTIDCIATDHAPHGLEEKSKSFLESPFGIVGSETAFQLIYTHFVETNRFTLEQVINWMATKPAEIFQLEAGTLTVGAPADVAVFDIEHSSTIDKKDFLSKGENTPFVGWNVKGETLGTFVDAQRGVKQMERLLILEDGTVFKGKAFGANNNVFGEIVFTTSMTGYQETITDQSFNGQIITFTYPMVGNYGVNRDDYESIAPTCKGVVVKEHARVASNWRSQMTLDEFLKRKGIPGISGIDTRALTRKIRQVGTMKASIVDAGDSFEHAYDQLKATVLATNQVQQVSTSKPYPSPGTGKNVAVIDFGLKHSILRELSKRNCNLTVLPYNTDAKTILSLAPDGVMLTNGPGDPKDVPEAIEMIREIQGKIPIFGICLGHQLFALANGADTYKMKFGHRGLNHPVREIATGRIDFTSQNHGYAVDEKTVDPDQLLITHVEVNDGTVEGIRHRHYPAFSVQFHPDAAPGPHDALHLFDEFMEMMDAGEEK